MAHKILHVGGIAVRPRLLLVNAEAGFVNGGPRTTCRSWT